MSENSTTPEAVEDAAKAGGERLAEVGRRPGAAAGGTDPRLRPRPRHGRQGDGLGRGGEPQGRLRHRQFRDRHPHRGRLLRRRGLHPPLRHPHRPDAARARADDRDHRLGRRHARQRLRHLLHLHARGTDLPRRRHRRRGPRRGGAHRRLLSRPGARPDVRDDPRRRTRRRRRRLLRLQRDLLADRLALAVLPDGDPGARPRLGDLALPAGAGAGRPELDLGGREPHPLAGGGRRAPRTRPRSRRFVRPAPRRRNGSRRRSSGSGVKPRRAACPARGSDQPEPVVGAALRRQDPDLRAPGGRPRRSATTSSPASAPSASSTSPSTTACRAPCSAG